MSTWRCIYTTKYVPAKTAAPESETSPKAKKSVVGLATPLTGEDEVGDAVVDALVPVAVALD
jgi:hypothetical protein